MAWGYIKLIQRKNKASSSNNCNKIFGLLKLRSFGRQTKVTQWSKHAIPCHAFGGEKSAMRPSKRQLGRFRGKKSLLFEKKRATFYEF